MKNSTGTVDVGAATGSVGTGTDQDWFAVELETAKRYQIDLEGVDTRRGSLPDPVLELFDATGTSLSASDDDGGVGKNARLIYTPSAAGAYHVQASKRSGSGGGTYTLSVIHLGANGVSEADTDFSDDTSTSGRVEVGGPVTGTVTAANVIDWFAVDLEAGRRYRIDLEGADTNRGTLPDPVLWQILAPGDNLIYDDDDEVGDSGQGANSRMFSLRTWTAPTTWSRKLEGPQIETMLEAPTRQPTTWSRSVRWRHLLSVRPGGPLRRRLRVRRSR